MAEARVLVETMDGVGLVTFCGAEPRNAITPAMWQGLGEAVARLEGDASVRVLVLTGAGHTAFATDPVEPDPAAERAALERLRGCEKPVIARLRGECVGAGLAVALCADIRIAAADTDFAITGARAAELGVDKLLVDCVGAGQARFLLLTGERIETAEALRLGLVARVAPDADLSDVVADLARQLADADSEGIRATKRGLARISGQVGARDWLPE